MTEFTLKIDPDLLEDVKDKANQLHVPADALICAYVEAGLISDKVVKAAIALAKRKA